MPGRLSWLKHEVLIGGEWDGLELDAPLRHLKAGIGAGSSTLADALWITLGAVSLKLLPAATEQVQAMRATVAFDCGVWIITHELPTQEISFLNTATGEVTTFPLVSETGERTAGSYSVELMGIPAVETARGSVTLDSMMALCYLQQVHASHTVYGGANLNDLGVTIEVCFGLLDEEAATRKARAAAAKRDATRAATVLKKAMEQRLADGLPTSADFDADEARLTKHLEAINAEFLRLATELEAHEAIFANRSSEKGQGLQRAAEAGRAADRAYQALAPHYEARGQARAALAQAEQDAKPPMHCPECAQMLQQAKAPGPACLLCGQPDPDQAVRQARKDHRLTAAQAALRALEDRLQAAQTGAQQAADARNALTEAARQAASRCDAYRVAEITPREQAKAKAAATAAETRAAITAVRERRKELTRLNELERAHQRTADNAEQARLAWAMAEGDAQHVREQTAKQLSIIFAEKVMAMAPDKIRHASIDPKTFTPRLNGRTVRQLSRSAGMINIANNGLHLTFLDAARTLPGVLLPRLQWLDASLDGLGAGEEGARLAASTLQVVSATVADDAQIIIATAHDMPHSPGMLATEHDSHHPVIPHARMTDDTAWPGR
ncbi:hypothetical protein [Streptomyces sp. NPDC005374]|uniref:hypothetical protein n=1 Tax=Streptomyces sp. NPDC005374 TaxID=3364713 RepID=UPI00368A41CA